MMIVLLQKLPSRLLISPEPSKGQDASPDQARTKVFGGAKNGNFS